MRLTTLTLLLIAGLGLGACGQKGPLYLPEQPGTQDTEEQKS